MITYFTAGEHSPSPTDAFNSEGRLIVGTSGMIALKGFMVDPFVRGSEVTLDESVEPPVLRLRKAMTSTLFGDQRPNGEFVQWTNEMNQGEHIVSGDYVGPGSELELE